MEGMQRYRIGTFPCDTADMTRNTISTLFPIRKKSRFTPLYPNGIRLIRLIRLFFSLVPEWSLGNEKNDTLVIEGDEMRFAYGSDLM